MDPGTRIQLKARIRQEVETMLTEGDRVYLRELSPSALLEAVESELHFLGLYAHEDHETPVVIHKILEEHLDAWCQLYLWSPKVDIDASPLIQESQSAGVKIRFGDETFYFDFGQTMESSHSEVEIDASPLIQKSQSAGVKIRFGDETQNFDFGQTTEPLHSETMI